jgi:TonB family protein
MRRLAVVLLLTAAGTAGAVGQWTSVAKTAEVSRGAGAARWNVWTESFTRERCAPLGSGVLEGSDKDHYNCLLHTLFVRNETTTPLQCDLVLEVTTASYEGKTRELAYDIIYPGKQGTVSSMGPTSSSIGSHTTSCVAIPAEPPPAVVAAGCQAEVTPHDIEFYYPRGAMRRLQEGTVQVEYSTLPDRRWLHEVRVVRSSGIQSLDVAALRYARGLRASSNCPGQRFRYDVVFKMTQFMIDQYGPREPVIHR